VHITHLFNHYLRLSHFPLPWKERMWQRYQNWVRTQNFLNISFLSTTGELLEKAALTIEQRHAGETNLLHAGQFGFCHRQCMRLTDHVTLNFSNNLPTAAVLLDTEKAFDTTWHPGIL